MRVLWVEGLQGSSKMPTKSLECLLQPTEPCSAAHSCPVRCEGSPSLTCHTPTRQQHCPNPQAGINPSASLSWLPTKLGMWCPTSAVP